MRLITTNFDPHFIRAAGEQFEDGATVFDAQALLLSNRFERIVYLHGSVEQDPENSFSPTGTSAAPTYRRMGVKVPTGDVQ